MCNDKHYSVCAKRDRRARHATTARATTARTMTRLLRNWHLLHNWFETSTCRQRTTTSDSRHAAIILHGIINRCGKVLEPAGLRADLVAPCCTSRIASAQVAAGGRTRSGLAHAAHIMARAIRPDFRVALL